MQGSQTQGYKRGPSHGELEVQWARNRFVTKVLSMRMASSSVCVCVCRWQWGVLVEAHFHTLKLVHIIFTDVRANIFISGGPSLIRVVKFISYKFKKKNETWTIATKHIFYLVIV